MIFRCSTRCVCVFTLALVVVWRVPSDFDLIGFHQLLDCTFESFAQIVLQNLGWAMFSEDCNEMFSNLFALLLALQRA